MDDLTSRPEEGKTKIRLLIRGIYNYVTSLTAFIVNAVFLLILTVLIAVIILNIFSPGFVFQLPILVILLFLVFILAHAPSWAGRKKRPVIQKPQILTLHQKLIYGSIIVAIPVISVGGYAINLHNENVTLENARSRFDVTVKGEISANRIDSSLIEFENQFEHLNAIFGSVGIDERIKIVLYPDATELKKANPVPGWFEGFVTFETGKPVIHLPAEQASGSSYKTNRFSSPGPGHELTHLMIYEMLGESYYRNVPRWLNEGLAEYESTKGWQNWVPNAIQRTGLWNFNIGNPATLKDDKFILQSSQYPNENIDIYYIASWQFVKYLSQKYDMLSILKTMSNGEDFLPSFIHETGKTPQQLYEEWKKYYF